MSDWGVCKLAVPETSKVPYLLLSLSDAESLIDFVISRTFTEKADNVLKKFDVFLDEHTGVGVKYNDADPTDDFTEEEWQMVVDAACNEVTRLYSIYSDSIFGSILRAQYFLYQVPQQ